MQTTPMNITELLNIYRNKLAKKIANSMREGDHEEVDLNMLWIYSMLQTYANGDYVSPGTERTSAGCYSRFGASPFSKINLRTTQPFPLISARHIGARIFIAEMLWFMRGSTNVNELRILGGGSIWDKWANAQGDVGPLYGKQWRDFPGVSLSGVAQSVDQLARVFENLKTNPTSRRHVVNVWNPTLIPQDDNVEPKHNVDNGLMSIAPCHQQFQFYMTEKSRVLSLKLDMRSNDLFIGAPFNLAGYAFLLLAFAKCLGATPGDLFYTVGDAHLYANHVDSMKEVAEKYLNFIQNGGEVCKPKLEFTDHPACGKPWHEMKPWEIEPTDVSLVGYESLGSVTAPINV